MKTNLQKGIAPSQTPAGSVPATVKHGPASTPPAYHTISLVACLVGTFVLRMASSIMGSTIQLYFGYIDQHFYPLSDTARGFALAVFFLPELIGSPLFGAWSDRLGRKWFILLGSIFGGIGVQITAMTTDFAALSVMRLLGGASTASAVPATLSYLSAMTAHSESLRGRVMGLFQVATLGGTILGMLAGGRLWDLFHQGAFTIDAVIYLLSLLIFLFGIQEARLAGSRHTVGGAIAHGWRALKDTFAHYQRVFTSPVVLRFAPAFLAINMVLGIWLNHIISQLVASDQEFPNQLLYGILANNRNAGTDIALYGTGILAIFGVGALAWSFVVGRVRRTSLMLVNAGALFLLCAILFALNHTASLTAPVVPLYLVLAALALLILSGLMPAALTYLADMTEEKSEDRGAIMGLYTIFFGFGGFLGTLLGGPFADWDGIDGILTLTVLLGIIAAVLLIRLHLAESNVSKEPEGILSKEE
ncbi:MAG TPA: MFS transporter [Anaerolineae bacterium]